MTPTLETTEQKWLSRASVIQWIVGGVIAVTVSFGSFQYSRSEEAAKLKAVQVEQDELKLTMKERRAERDRQFEELKTDMKEGFQVLREDNRHTQELVEELLKQKR